MLNSGVAQRKARDQTLDEDEEATRVHLLVHDIRPPFLDGRKIFTKQIEPVSAVRDPQSDMAVFSRKGSKVVKERREQRQRQKQAEEATNIGGTALGNIMGVKGTVSGVSSIDRDTNINQRGRWRHSSPRSGRGRIQGNLQIC